MQQPGSKSVKQSSMKRISILLAGFIVLLGQAAYTQTSEIRYEILLNNNMLHEASLKEPLSYCLDVSPGNFVTISTASQMYLLGWGGITTIGNKSNKPLSSFAYTSDGLLMAVEDKDLCCLNKEGNWEILAKLPSPGMSLASGKEVMYVYDNGQNKKRYHAFALARGGKYMHLLSSSEPVTGICEMNDSVYFSIGSGIYSYSPQNKKLVPFFALGRENKISSLTSSQKEGILYFSTMTAIYALKGNSLVRISAEFPSTTVKCYGNGLLIFNASSNDILRIVNVQSSIEF